jgi:hypothetical protein
LRQRPNRISSSESGASAGSSAGASANTSAIDAVTAGSTNSGGGRPGSSGAPRPGSAGKDKGKRISGELEDVRPKVISPELRGLLSRKVEVLPRKVVRKTGEGLSSLGDGKGKDKK